MTPLLWILAIGFMVGVILLIVFCKMKKPKPVGIVISLALSIVCLAGFVLDIALDPVKGDAPPPPAETETSFAETNGISEELAESLESVLSELEFTDKSVAGVFHYTLSDISNWKQVEDWADGERYQAWMAREHILVFYVTGDTVVGVRDTQGNVFYSSED